eukprot:Blabericola_migrator_1__4739@NODE_249_length_10888_cov_100_919231_g210_i0_p7_GENE_NODE_249_length_10888_cov_100_919231_g210_i0NODE_249_length_10888_cov_100_919231_g210_i0_p7_ORF_typecomplete_len169_score39_63CbiX/PF01903_17/0_25_NODE_249_length_10888_cov_100_919231_g210_i092569762
MTAVSNEVLIPSTTSYIRQCVAADTLHSSKELLQYSDVLRTPQLAKKMLEEGRVRDYPGGQPRIRVLCLENTPETTVKSLATLRALQCQESVPLDLFVNSGTNTDRKREISDILQRINNHRELSVVGDVVESKIIKVGRIPIIDGVWDNVELQSLKDYIDRALNLIKV